MQTRTQRQGAPGPHAARGATDWQALEVQLNRTRTILQEILLHLQEVLKNLKMARGGGLGGATRTEAGSARRPGQDFRATAGNRTRPQGAYQSTHHRAERGQTPPPGPGATGATGASDRFRARPRHGGSEARTETRAGADAGAKARAEDAWSHRFGANGARPGTGAAGAAGPGRERPRTDTGWRTRAAGPAAGEREARPGQASGPKPGPRPPHRGQGFRMDGDRQRRARETARKNGMNLKCAYDILCLDYPCSPDDIKLAYRHMARLHHPDLGGDEEAMKDVNVAYELAMRFCSGARRTSTAWAV
jgi:hypothetical protein